MNTSVLNVCLCDEEKNCIELNPLKQKQKSIKLKLFEKIKYKNRLRLKIFHLFKSFCFFVCFLILQFWYYWIQHNSASSLASRCDVFILHIKSAGDSKTRRAQAHLWKDGIFSKSSLAKGKGLKVFVVVVEEDGFSSSFLIL